MVFAKRFEDLEVWQTARELTRQIYELTCTGNFSHDFGLRDQLRRAAVSIMSNIAEGFESGSKPAYLRYLSYAKASAGEVRAQLYVALDAGYLAPDTFDALRDLAEKCSAQLSRFMTSLGGTYPREHVGTIDWRIL